MYIKEKISNVITKYKINQYQKIKRKQLNSLDFTIISNNCWAGTAVYQTFGLRYNTPTVGLFFFDRDYIEFLENLKFNLNQPLKFIKFSDSKYYSSIRGQKKNNVSYPIGLIGENIEIHFLHYSSEKEALEKWNRRVKRINWNRLIIKMSIREPDSNLEDLINRFIKLEFKNKICFTPSKLEYDNECIIEIPELKTLNLVGGDETNFTLQKINLIDLLNESI